VGLTLLNFVLLSVSWDAGR